MPISNTDNIIDSREVEIEVDDLECTISCHEDDIAEHRDSISDKEEELEEFEERLGELTEEKNAGEISRINNFVEQLNEEIEEIKGFIDLIENDIIDAKDELQPLAEFKDGFDNYSNDGTLIHEDYFQTYAMQLAEDIGGADTREWPACHIDWEAAADALLMDYTAVDFDGTTYYVR